MRNLAPLNGHFEDEHGSWCWDTTIPDWVYFLLDSERGRVKIGHSTNPLVRQRYIERYGEVQALTLTPLGYIRGGRDLEQFLHFVFRANRVRDEWFSYKGIEIAIDEYVSRYGDHDLARGYDALKYKLLSNSRLSTSVIGQAMKLYARKNRIPDYMGLYPAKLFEQALEYCAYSDSPDVAPLLKGKCRIHFEGYRCGACGTVLAGNKPVLAVGREQGDFRWLTYCKECGGQINAGVTWLQKPERRRAWDIS